MLEFTYGRDLDITANERLGQRSIIDVERDGVDLTRLCVRINAVTQPTAIPRLCIGLAGMPNGHAFKVRTIRVGIANTLNHCQLLHFK